MSHRPLPRRVGGGRHASLFANASNVGVTAVLGPDQLLTATLTPTTVPVAKSGPDVDRHEAAASNVGVTALLGPNQLLTATLTPTTVVPVAKSGPDLTMQERVDRH